MLNQNAGMRKSVEAARKRWTDGKETIRTLHEEGKSGRRVVHALSDLLDLVLKDIFSSAISEINHELEQRVAVVLHGGNGRRDVAPYSDVDLMVVYQGSLTDDVAEFSRRVSQDITDSGLQLGYSLRTPREACTMSLKDPEIFSSLTESRFLCGNIQLFDSYLARFRRLATRRATNMIRGIVDARKKERRQFGESVYLLRPNIKKSGGALRDVHLIRWLGFVRFGETDIDQLCRRRALTSEDATQLQASTEFLLRVRNEMHFHADRANDSLGRNEQVRLAERFEYEGTKGVLSVEKMMRDYFRYTSRIRYISDHFVETSLARRSATSTVFVPLVTRNVDDIFRMGPADIGVSKAALDNVRGDLEQVLRLMQLASLHGKEIEHETWVAIRKTMLAEPEVELKRSSARRFMALLSNTSGLPRLLKKLHEMQVLSKLIPAFNHARGLMQFNEYHVYTVDEHSLKAVYEAVSLEDEQSIVGQTYRQIREKNLLHLALLLHDLGKGYPEDHSIVGAEIAIDTGKRLDLNEEEIETIRFLVRNHLVMSHLAFHRDINDEAMVAEFASNVASVQLLSMLFVLTCADIAAVSPGMLNSWKLALLTDLFVQAKRLLTGATDREARHERLHDEIAAHGSNRDESLWLKNAARNLPNNYCVLHESENIANQLLTLKKTKEVHCWINKVPDTNLIELCIGKQGRRRSGVFSRVSGTLLSLGLDIHGADIAPIDSSLVWYWFKFEDLDFATPPESRLEEIMERVRDVALNLDQGPPTFRRIWGKKETEALKLSRPKLQVKIDNQTVDTATIIDVFAYNKVGLLYMISKKIFELGLDVSFARVSTYAHQVILVFYVTDERGSKIRNKNQISIINKEVLNATRAFLEPDESEKL